MSPCFARASSVTCFGKREKRAKKGSDPGSAQSLADVPSAEGTGDGAIDGGGISRDDGGLIGGGLNTGNCEMFLTTEMDDGMVM